ncbi:MAG: NADH-quinone oxidoreductase subunit A [Planctomycetota bacterium]
MLLASSSFSMWAAVGVLLLMAVGFGVGNVFLTHVLGPSRKGEVKGTVYESGMNPIGDARRRFNVRFYVVAMTFLLFDVEIVFLYPWATTFPKLGGSVGDELSPMFFGRMAFFTLTSVIAFAYAWRKGVFRYD